MKKLFIIVAAVFAAVTMNATTVVFDFSDPASLGYAKADAGKFTQVDSAATIEKDGIVITVAFPAGKNGFRFFTNTNTGVASLRGYVGASFTIAAPANNKLFSVSAQGSNLGTSYVAGDLVAGAWTSETGAASIAGSIIQSTVYFDKLTVIVAADGDTPEIPTAQKVTVAEAITAGNALAKGATSEQQYEVTGYVVNAEPFSNQHGNQIWWMSDDAANTGNQEFEAYACTIKEAGQQVINGDKVKLTGYITKYEDTQNGNKIIIEIKNGSAEFIEKAEGDHSILPDKVDTISVTEAVEEALKLDTNAVSSKTYLVKGYVAKIKTAYSAKYKNITLFMTDDPTSTYGDLQAYRISMKQEDSVKVVPHAYIHVKGKLKNNYYNNKSTAYIQDGSLTVEEAPALDLDTIGAAEALTRAKALPAGGSELVCVEAYVASIKTAYSSEAGFITVFLSDDPTSTYGDIQAFKASCSATDGPNVVAHCRVRVVGNITHSTYEQGGETKDSYEIAQGAQLVILNGAGVEQTIVLDKAVKMIENGQLIIEKNGVKYNAQGAVVK